MQLNVLLFASYAEVIGAHAVAVSVPETATVGDVVAAVRALVPDSELPPALVAVNQVYAQPSQLVCEGDEVAIIPPVAGG